MFKKPYGLQRDLRDKYPEAMVKATATKRGADGSYRWALIVNNGKTYKVISRDLTSRAFIAKCCEVIG